MLYLLGWFLTGLLMGSIFGQICVVMCSDWPYFQYGTPGK